METSIIIETIIKAAIILAVFGFVLILLMEKLALKKQ